MSDRDREVFDLFVKLPDYDAEYPGEFKRSVGVVQREEMESDELVGYVEKLRTFTKFYESENNPYFAVLAFNLSRRYGYYPPRWVMDYLFDSFEGFIKSDTSISIDRCMGLQGKKQSTSRKKAVKSNYEYTLFLWVIYLNKVCEVSIEKAAELAYDRALKNISDFNLGESIKILSPETINHYYTDEWLKWRPDIEQLSPTSWSEIRKRIFLDKFT